MTGPTPCDCAVQELELGGSRVVVRSVASGDPKAREELVAALVAGLRRAGASMPGTDGATLAHDRWGRPFLEGRRTGAELPVSLSFSRGAARSWGAIARGCRVGIDAASPREFDARYPWSRVFGDAEMRLALELTGGRQPDAAALLWAAKEAAVKALGRGFHAFDFREVEVPARVPGEGRLVFTMSAGRTTPAAWCGRVDEEGWLAVAVVPGGRRALEPPSQVEA